MATEPEFEIEDWQTAYNAAKTPEEAEKAIQDYSDAKLRNVERRQAARFKRAIERANKRKESYKKAKESYKNATKKVQSMLNSLKDTWNKMAGAIKNFFQKTK